MRLRYIHLPDYGPLKDVAVVFQQNPHIEGRAGAVNFVVGLNGSGKSSLLRAIYDVFHSLSREELPDFPVTLAYDRLVGRSRDELDQRRGKVTAEEIEQTHSKEFARHTVIFYRHRGAPSESFLVPLSDGLDFASADEWQHHVEQILASKGGADSLGGYVPGDQLKGNGDLRNWLPSRVLAYTSGDMQPWENLTYPDYPADELGNPPEESDREQERPAGWRAEQEHYDVRIPTVGDPAFDAPFSEPKPGSESLSDRCLLLTPEDARLAAVSVGIWQAAQELMHRENHADREAFRQKLIQVTDTGKMAEEPARRVLNLMDWLWPTHVAFHFASYAEHLRNPYAAACFWLFSLAETVVAHPLGETLASVSLGHCPPVDAIKQLADQGIEFDAGLSLHMMAKDIDQCTTGADALWQLFAGEHDIEEALWLIFSTLRGWREAGLLKDVDLTVQRIHKTRRADGAEDEQILAYTSFSDGEQMLLGRMAFLMLLRKQENSLLLLDEPETHFNDAWKRQIIDMVDDAILKDTTAQVLVSTHTSLALTDVFSCEITRLVKHGRTTRAEPVMHPTFGADPGRILLHVFGAPDIIGARAAEFLRSKLDPAKWPPEDREKLRTLIDEIGSGWPRSRLLDILDNLESSTVGSGGEEDTASRDITL